MLTGSWQLKGFGRGYHSSRALGKQMVTVVQKNILCKVKRRGDVIVGEVERLKCSLKNGGCGRALSFVAAVSGLSAFITVVAPWPYF
jgi:hypothetical protein